MEPHEFWQKMEAPGAFGEVGSHSDFYPAAFDDGRQLLLPIRPLADGARALASLILNQASFEVVDAIAVDLAAKLSGALPEIIVGLPTLGLTLASVLAQRLGHRRYVPARDIAQILVPRGTLGPLVVDHDARAGKASLRRSENVAASDR